MLVSWPKSNRVKSTNDRLYFSPGDDNGVVVTAFGRPMTRNKTPRGKVIIALRNLK